MAGGWDCHVHVFDASAPLRPGHYQPVPRPLAQIEAEAASAGVHHLVLVQPSVYGVDNGLLLRALSIEPGRHRGVVVIDEDTDDDALDAMHAAGVRGARLNLVSPAGERSDAARRFDRLAPRLRARNWHLQWYAAAHQLPQVAALHAGCGLDAVLDHLGGIGAGIGPGGPAWKSLQGLAAQGAWIKLSGWYRLGAAEPYRELWPIVQRIGDLFGERMVWGSDWPHTFYAPAAMPSYASTWTPVVAGLGSEAAANLRARTPSIYA